MNKTKLKRILSDAVAKITVSIAGVSISLADIGSSKNVDERIARLGEIKSDLEAAIAAVDQLQKDANESKEEVSQLQTNIAALQQDKATAERLLNVPEESFARLLARATRRGRIGGIILGVIIGLLTGYISSYAVWFMTRDKVKTPTPAPTEHRQPIPASNE